MIIWIKPSDVMKVRENLHLRMRENVTRKNVILLLILKVYLKKYILNLYICINLLKFLNPRRRIGKRI